jgi:polysaccharide export outer membrane protein
MKPPIAIKPNRKNQKPPVLEDSNREFLSGLLHMTTKILIPFVLSVAAVAQVSAPSNAYLLGPGDQVSVFVSELADEFADKTFRVDSSGDISLPVIGHLHATGLTTNELEDAAKTALVHTLRNPKVSITLTAFGSQSVSVLGAVNSPGLRQLEGHKSLFEILSAAGGLRPDAGYQVTVTRELKWGPIPLPQAMTDPSGKASIVSIKLKSLMSSANPAENIAILPGDTISVPKADLVYAVGDVIKPGGFALNEHASLSALQVVSLAEGTKKTAALNKAKILRTVPGSPNRTEIPVDLKLLMAGKGPDVQLQPDDILFVPGSGAKSAGYRTLDAIINAAAFAARY